MTPNPEQSERLLALAAQCEAASGPDRELDARIWCEVGNELGHDDPPQKHRLMRPVQPRICIMGRWLGSALDKFPEDIEGVAHNWHVPALSASLDAAMTLIPAQYRLGTLLEFDGDGRWAAKLFNRGKPGGLPAAGGSSAALAVVVACLRARAACLVEGEGKGG